MRLLFFSASLLLSVPMWPTARAHAAPADFTREVRPILSRHCFKCHGPDEKARKAKLRLDVRASAVGKAIVPGKPDESELVRRIFAADESEMMPPPATRNPLTPAQKEILKRWIAEGAEYREHWAFVTPRQSPLPEVRQAAWPRNAVDYFVLAKMEQAGLQPSPPADKYTLVRRVYFDLIGLPPTPQEADAFVHDRAPGAYERLVDRLLASPHYGERWARRWLDLARYADTNGYEKDRARSIWPYRDWVIAAFNRDMPFDQFTIEQLAGDMLPGATVEQRIATGFHRNTMLNEEGGIDPLEFRYYAMTDRVGTTGTVWLGLTVGCAQCHTHKFDPITHREYYQFMAFLNNADEPVMDIPRPDLAARRAAIEKQVAARIADLPNRFPPLEDKSTRPLALRRRDNLERKFNAWVDQEAARAVHWTVLRPESAKGNVPHLSVLDDSSALASGDQTKRDVYDLTYSTGLKRITAIRLEVLPHESLPMRGPGRVYYEGAPGDFFLSEFTLTAAGKPVKFTRATQSHADGPHNAAKAIDDNPHTGWSINGAQGQAHAAVFNLATPLADAKSLDLHMVCEKYYAAGLGRFRVSVTSDEGHVSNLPASVGQVSNLPVSVGQVSNLPVRERQVKNLPYAPEARGLPADVEEILLIPEGKRTPAKRERLLQQYLSVAPELAGERDAIKKLREQTPAYPTSLVLAERPRDNPRQTFIHGRGEFLQTGERVEANVLSILPPLPTEAPHNRLTFARWLVDPRNPLVGRVTANRNWAAFFGRGIVRTTEDFGYQGDPPSHPELLDWLAVELVNQGWSMKNLHRIIVTSATYQQASHVTPGLLTKDPQNILLARGPRFRIEAELVRDAALRMAGLLSEKVGGPSVFPPQPPGVTTEGTYGAIGWKVSAGQDRYRRGLYTFSKRTAPYAMFNTFDAPSGEACVARREISNTPLQALTLLNDPVFEEVARSIGGETAALEGSAETRLTQLFRSFLTRPPTEEEMALLLQFYRAQKDRLVRKEVDATLIAGPGPGDVQERAAWTMVARTLLNLDETIGKD